MMVTNPQQPINEREQRIFNQFKTELATQKNVVGEQYKAQDVPDVYKNDWARVAPTYEMYLLDRIEFSPADHKELGRLWDRMSLENENGMNTLKQLNCHMVSSAEWYASVYTLDFFENSQQVLLQWYLHDATILMAKFESSQRWINTLYQLRAELEGGDWFYNWRMILGVLAAIVFFFNGDYFIFSLFFLGLAGLMFYLKTIKRAKKNQQITEINEELVSAESVHNWNIQKANEHELIQRQGDKSSSFFFSHLFEYISEGRASSLEQAINLYYQEQQQQAFLQQQQQMINQQAQLSQQVSHLNTMTAINTVRNLFKD